MSDLAQRIDSSANAGLLIQQWRRAPPMKALVEGLLRVVDDIWSSRWLIWSV